MARGYEQRAERSVLLTSEWLFSPENVDPGAFCLLFVVDLSPSLHHRGACKQHVRVATQNNSSDRGAS